jgi:hypothetical protein
VEAPFELGITVSAGAEHDVVGNAERVTTSSEEVLDGQDSHTRVVEVELAGYFVAVHE